MKRFLALLLVVALTACFAVVASAEDKTYTDKVSLLPTDASKVTQVPNTVQTNEDGTLKSSKVDFSIADGKLTIAKAEESQLAWPAVEIGEAAGKVVDLSQTPYLHLDFTIPDRDQTNEVGVNGVITYTVEGSGEEKTAQLSAIATGKANDFKQSTNAYYDFSSYAGTTGKITIKSVTLSIYVWKVTWNALSFAKEGADEPDQGGTDQGGTDQGGDKEEDSTPAASSPEASTPTSSDKPSAGDTGVLVFAVMGVVAVAGVAVAVKTRR